MSSVAANPATPNAATPVSAAVTTVVQVTSAAAPATTSVAPVPAATSAVTSVAAPAATSAAAPVSSAVAAASSSRVSSAAVAASASSSAVASSSSASASSSRAASSSVSSSISSISSSIHSSSSYSSSASASSTSIANAGTSASSAGTNGLSPGVIGGIAGGAVGGLILLAFLWSCWRRRRERSERVAPPPPRDPHLPVPVMSTRNKLNSGSMITRPARTNSYSSNLLPQSPQYGSHSRSPSYYASYPVASPSSGPVESPTLASSTASDSPPFTATGTPALKPQLAPLITTLQRDDSTSSGERESVRERERDRTSAGREFGANPKHKSSVDRLRYEATYPIYSGPGSRAGSERAPSPSNSHIPSETDVPSRTASPHPSSLHGHIAGSNYNGVPSPSSLSRQSFSPSDGTYHPPSYPRPMSMASISSHAPSINTLGGGTGRYLRPSGAPHAGRAIQLEMPKLLGARPDSNGDFFPGHQRVDSGFGVPIAPYDGGNGGLYGHGRRVSRTMQVQDMDFAPGPRIPSTASSRSNLYNSTLPHRSHSNATSGSGRDSSGMDDRGVVEIVTHGSR